MDAFLLLLLTLVASPCTSLPPPSSRSPSLYGARVRGASNSSFTWQEKYTASFVDQFNFFGEQSSLTFQQRYLISLDSWGGPTHPLFVYAGNEGDITLFTNNTGFLWALAETMGAMVVFIEHRFYGDSLPYGKDSYLIKNLGVLGIEQALLDYVQIVASLKANHSCPDAPVFVWGGSYGGMLAAWARIKYPAVFQGAYASSAPILQIPGLMDPGAYSAVIKSTFSRGPNPSAPLGIYLGFQAMLNMSATAAGRKEISSLLRICGNPMAKQSDVYSVMGWLSSAIGFVAMADYRSFLLFAPLGPPAPCLLSVLSLLFS